MSDWEDLCGSMGWANDEYSTDKLINHIENNNLKQEEYNLRQEGYKTVSEWNVIGRSVKKGEKGKYLSTEKISVFSEKQTINNNVISKRLTDKQYFETFEDAMIWARRNPGRVFTRSPTGEGYVEK